MAAQWVARCGQELGLDAERLAVAGDSVGGNMATVITLLSRERGGPDIRLQLLFYPVTDAAFDTASYHQFAEGYHLRRDAMMWFWEQYTRHPGERNEITASPLRASTQQLQRLPRRSSSPPRPMCCAMKGRRMPTSCVRRECASQRYGSRAPSTTS